MILFTFNLKYLTKEQLIEESTGDGSRDVVVHLTSYDYLNIDLSLVFC